MNIDTYRKDRDDKHRDRKRGESAVFWFMFGICIVLTGGLLFTPYWGSLVSRGVIS